MPILRDKVLQNKQSRDWNDAQDDTRGIKRSLRNARQLTGKRRTVTIGATASAVIVHGLDYIPRGYAIEQGENNAITMTSKTKTELTLANASGAAVTVTIWIY